MTTTFEDKLYAVLHDALEQQPEAVRAAVAASPGVSVRTEDGWLLCEAAGRLIATVEMSWLLDDRRGLDSLTTAWSPDAESIPDDVSALTAGD